MSLADYGRRELEPAWTSLLEAAFPLKAEKICRCRQEFSAWKDSNGHVLYRAMYCQEREICPVCGRVYAESLATDAIDLVREVDRAMGGVVKFASVEFSVPFEARERVRDEDLGVIRKMGWEVLKEILGRGEDGEERFVIAGIGASHFWHTENPYSAWYPHVHLTVLDIAFDLRDNVFRRLDLFLNDEKLLALRELWRVKFEARYGRTLTKSFDVHWHYSGGYKHLRHRLVYALRRPVYDCYMYVRSTHKIPHVRFEWLKRMLRRPKNEKRIQSYGWLSDGVRSGFLLKLKLVRKKKAERDRERRRVFCLICGEEMFCVERRIGYDELSEGRVGVRILAFPRPWQVVRWPT